VRGQLAREYDAAIARLDADEAAALAPTDSPLQRVVEAGYVNLPLRWKAWVEGDDAETRQWALRFAVAVLRRALVLEARDQRPRALTPPPEDAEGVPGKFVADQYADWFPEPAFVDPYVVLAAPGARPL
jgi:hypothetical protein